MSFVLADDHDTLFGIAVAAKVFARRHLGAIERHQCGGEGRPGFGEQFEIPVAGRDERNTFALALDNQTNGWALHPTGRQTTVHAPPQHGADFVAIETVENAAGLGSIDQAIVERSWIVDCLINCSLGDFVEHHPLYGHLGLEVLEQVPANGLTLAVFVGCEIELARIFQQRPKVFDNNLAALGEFVGWFEAVVDIDGQTFARQVGNVAN